MHLVDTTMFYCARSGGVKRYLLAKRDWLAHHCPSISHTLLVPAPQRAGRGTQTCDACALHLPDGYRFPLDVWRWRRELLELRPDIIEAADPYVPGWAVRGAGDRLGIPTIAFYHSDVPRLLSQRFGAWTSPFARSYLRRLYAGFDLILAPSAIMQDHGALPELVDEAVGACARTPSPTLLASAVQSVFERDANALQIAARARVEQKYSWDRVFTQLVSRYAALADRAPISQLAPIGA